MSSSGSDKNSPLDCKFSSLKLFAPNRQPIKKERTSVTFKRDKSQIARTPVSPNLKHINNNAPQLNLSNTDLDNTNDPNEFNFSADIG